MKLHVMKNLTIRRRIVASFAIIVALMAVMGTVAYARLVRVGKLTNSIETDSVAGLYWGSQITVALTDDYSLTLEYALQPDVAMKEKLRSEILSTRRAHVTTLLPRYESTIFTDTDRRNFETYKNARNLYVSAQDEVLKTGIEPGSVEDTGMRPVITCNLCPQ